MKTEKENYIQQQCVMWFNNKYCLKHHSPRWIIFSVPNEGEDAFEIKRKKDRGMLSGASDLIIVGTGITIFIEMKTPTGRQSDSQKDFEKRVTDLGHIYRISRSLEDFQELIIKIMSWHEQKQKS